MKFLQGLGVAGTVVGTTLGAQLIFGMAHGTRGKMDDILAPLAVGTTGLVLGAAESPYVVSSGATMLSNALVQGFDASAIGRRGIMGRRFI